MIYEELWVPDLRTDTTNKPTVCIWRGSKLPDLDNVGSVFC